MRNKWVDGLRGFAALYVLIAHALSIFYPWQSNPWRNEWYGEGVSALLGP
jgi:peptidoglycan/LPS O-acetylase OafA/YrhL